MDLRDGLLILTFIGLATSSFPTCPQDLRSQGTSVFITRCNLEEFTIFLEPQCYEDISSGSHVDPDKWIITSYKASDVEGFDKNVNQTCAQTKQNVAQTYWLNGDRHENVLADTFSFQHSDCGEIELKNSGEGTDSYYEVWISQLEGEQLIIGEWNVRCVVQNEEYNAAEYNVNTTRDASFDSTGIVNALALEIQSLESEAVRLGELQKVVVKTTASSAKFNETFDFRLDRCWGNNGEPGQSDKLRTMVILGGQTSGCPNSPIITSYTPKDFEFRTGLFETFKFPGSDTVRIQCEVKICEKNESGCEDPDCSENVRKRRSTGGQKQVLTEASFFHENDV